MRLADQRAADAGAVEGRLDRQRRQRDGREALAAILHVKPGKQDVADDLAIFLGHQFDDGVAAGDQGIDQAGFRLLAKGMFFDEADGLAIPRRRRAYRHHAHVSFVPFSILAPRKNSCAAAGLPPAR